MDDDLNDFSGAYIFEILNLLRLAEGKPRNNSESLYTTLRGIFLSNLRHDEKLALSHEDFILFYVLTILHPELPIFIKDKYVAKLATNKRIYDYKSEILGESDNFLSSIPRLKKKKKGKVKKTNVNVKIDELKMEVDYDTNNDIKSEFSPTNSGVRIFL